MDGWKLVPMPGAMVKSSHPQTVFNPDEYFAVAQVRFEGERVYARGENTIWFNIDMLTPKSVDADRSLSQRYPETGCAP